MSSQNQAPSEVTLLLGDSLQAGQFSRSPSRDKFGVSPQTLLIPVALATKLACGTPLTTLIQLVRQIVCQLWYVSHSDPATLRAGGPIPADQCDVPEVERHFSLAIATLGVTEGILAMAACGFLSHLSSLYGRKPALLVVLIAGIMGNSLIPGSQFTPDWLGDWLFLVGLFLQTSSGIIPYTYLVNMYIVDVCDAEDRTSALSKTAGWATLGTCISFFLGGFVTTKTGNPLIVFYIATTIFVATFIYVLSVLPESFPKEKRDALLCMRLESSADGFSTTARCSSLTLVLEPLKSLTPSRKSDGTPNWRLAWCAAHTFVYMTANAYTPTAWMVLVTSKSHLTPAQTGLFFTLITISGTIVLMVIVPYLVHFLRPYYKRRITRSLPADLHSRNSDNLESETSDRLDVHLAFVSCVIAATCSLGAAASTTDQAMIFFGICLGFTVVHTPTLRSLVAGSVDPLRQGETLAAIEMVASAGTLLSPIIMGSILTATIGTAPLFLFYINLIIIMISSAGLFFVRDADRYQKP